MELNEKTNYYETAFRQYDPQIGRFTAIDPLADQFGSWTPYQYGYNDPIYYNDPNGLLPHGHLAMDGNQSYSGGSSLGSNVVFGTGMRPNGSRIEYGTTVGMMIAEARRNADMYHNGATTYFQNGQSIGVDPNRISDYAPSVLRSAFRKARVRGKVDGKGEWIPAAEILQWDHTNQRADFRIAAMSAIYNNLFSSYGGVGFEAWLGTASLYAWGIREFYYGPRVRALSRFYGKSESIRLDASRQRNRITARAQRLTPQPYRALAQGQKNWQVNPNGRFAQPNGRVQMQMRGVGIGGGLLIGYGIYNSASNISAASELGYGTEAAINEGFSWAGSIAGGIAGAEVGAYVGAGIGAFFGGVGAVPGAAIGGFVGGLAGSITGGFAGYWAGSKITGYGN